MKTFREHIEESGTLLSEVKLSRVWKQLSDDETSVGIITAFRGGNSYEENVKLNKQLASKLRSKGFGFTFVDGAWVENEGTDEEITVSEDSIFVTAPKNKTEELFSVLVDAAKKYDQDGFSFKRAGSNSKYEIIDKNGKVDMTFNKVKFNKLADIYTKLRGKKGSFVFEEIAHTSAGFVANILNRAKLKEEGGMGVADAGLGGDPVDGILGDGDNNLPSASGEVSKRY